MSYTPREMVANFHKPIIKVKHSELKRVSDESLFHSKCSVCTDGVLLVRRDQKTFKIIADDICINCGQRYKYTDIKKMLKESGVWVD